jgi:hypothetical protein
VIAVAASAALLLTYGAGSALACGPFTLDVNQAREKDRINYEITGCQAGEPWYFYARFPGTDSQGNPTVEERSMHVDGTAAGADPITGSFEMIDLGADQDNINIVLYTDTPTGRTEATLAQPGGDPYPFAYLGQAPVIGPTGPTGGTTTGPVPVLAPIGSTGPVAVADPPARKKAKKKSSTKKKSSSGDSKKKSSKKNSGGDKDSGSSNPTPTSTPTYAAPTPSTPAPVIDTPSGSADVPTTADAPATPPPGIQGPADGITPPEPAAPAPVAPAAVAPAVQAASTSPDEYPLPVWLVVLLGLVALLCLGGAQARMLGLWGPQRPMAGGDTTDARLLALQRVSQSGANFQKRIAELKKAAREREPVG